MIDINDINPVDYYNMNCAQHTIDLLLKVRNVKQTSINTLTYVVNNGDEVKKMIRLTKDGIFIADIKNGLNLEVGKKYTPFMILQKCIHKNSFALSLSYVAYDLMNMPNEYIRVGTDYYKKIKKTDRFGIERSILKEWKRNTILDDNGKEILFNIEKFDDFTIVPDNKNYQSIIKNNYNLYAKFEHEETEEEDFSDGKWEWTKILFEHVFGNQYDLGIKYIKILYDHPRQALPILALISEERQTGKSTFSDWLTILFGANSAIINPQDIANQFNGSYATKNVIIIEESFFEKRGSVEKLKNLATLKTITLNNKHVNHTSIPFFGKIVINSNDEEHFIKIDSKEIRFWVRKIPSLNGKANHNILNDLTKEIPFFLRYLSSLPPIDLSKSRMAFEEIEINTKALDIVKEESRSELRKEIEMYIDNFCLQNRDTKTFFFTPLDVKNKFFHTNNQVRASYIRKILRSEMKLKNFKKTKRYIPFYDDSISSEYIYGKPYTFKNKHYKEDFQDENILQEEDTPF